MPFNTVIFDLFGTLAGSFSQQEYDPIYRRMADELLIPFDAFHEVLGRSYQEREVGRFASVEENIVHVCRESFGLEITNERAAHLALPHYEYVAKLIDPDIPVVNALRELKGKGFQLGLISNCGPDIPHMWDDCRLSNLMDVSIFSSEVKAKKPDPQIYLTACERLKVTPEACVYVGDGSSDELRGAKRVGMYPILKRVSLADVYDKNRNDVTAWNGTEINEIGDLLEILENL